MAAAVALQNEQDAEAERKLKDAEEARIRTQEMEKLGAQAKVGFVGKLKGLVKSAKELVLGGEDDNPEGEVVENVDAKVSSLGG